MRKIEFYSVKRIGSDRSYVCVRNNVEIIDFDSASNLNSKEYK